MQHRLTGVFPKHPSQDTSDTRQKSSRIFARRIMRGTFDDPRGIVLWNNASHSGERVSPDHEWLALFHNKARTIPLGRSARSSCSRARVVGSPENYCVLNIIVPAERSEASRARV